MHARRWRVLLLTLRTPVHPPASGDGSASDRSIAHAAGLARALVDVHAVLEAPWHAVDVAVGFVSGGGAPGLDPFRQHLTYGAPEPFSHRTCDSLDAAARPDAGAEADLVGIYLPDAGDHPLVHQHQFDLRAAPGEGVLEVLGRELVRERLGAVVLELGRLVYLVRGVGHH